MKEKWRNSHKLIIRNLIICLLAVIVIPGMKCEAAVKKPTCSRSKTTYVASSSHWQDGSMIAVANGYAYSKGTRFPLYLKVSNLDSGATITNVKSSNPGVLKAEYNASIYKKGLVVTFRGYGTSKITFTVKQNKKTYKLTCKYTFKKTPTPFSSLKIGGKQLASKYTGCTSCKYDVNKKSVKISCKAKKGYKIVSISYLDRKDNEIREIKLKNDSVIQIPKEGVQLTITYRYNKIKYGGKEYGANYDSVSVFMTR